MDACADRGRLLEDENNRFARKVPGLSGYLVWVGNRFDITVEFVAAERSFAEFETDRNQPLAWNFELAVNANPKLDIAFRVEGSQELAGFPTTQYGLATNLSLHPRATLTFELLRGKFTNNLAIDDDDNPFNNVTTVGAQLSVAF